MNQDQIVENILVERRKSHGNYVLGTAFTQCVMDRVMVTTNWDALEPFQKETVHMIVHKIQRILEGDPDNPEHWDDIAGYAKLVSKILRKEYP